MWRKWRLGIALRMSTIATPYSNTHVHVDRVCVVAVDTWPLLSYYMYTHVDSVCLSVDNNSTLREGKTLRLVRWKCKVWKFLNNDECTEMQALFFEYSHSLVEFWIRYKICINNSEYTRATNSLNTRTIDYLLIP